MISVDDTYHNEIVWKNWEEDVTYNIYREGAQAGQYDLAATIEPNSSNSWVDMESNAKIRSYRYKIAGIDTCGKESLQSSAHKTMHLTINAGMNNSWNLIWTPYEGSTYSQYNIYRDTGSSLGQWELIGTMPSINTSYSDFTAPQGYVYYMVEIVLDNPCVLTKSLSSIKSNIATNNPSGPYNNINNIDVSTLKVYPNPSKGQLIISLPNPAEGGAYEAGNVEIYNVAGQLLQSAPFKSPERGKLPSFGGGGGGSIVIDVSHLANGMYFLKVDNKVIKFIKE
jgi:hypothetical protein